MSSSNQTMQKPKFSIAITTKGYKDLINNTLGDPERAKRFVASITSAVAVNPALQDCDAGTILAGALLGESLNLSPSPQLGQYYLVLYDAAGYKGCAENALDVAKNISVNASEMYHAVFDEKAKALDESLRRADETLKHAQALSDTMVDAFHHRLDEAVKEAKSLDKR